MKIVDIDNKRFYGKELPGQNIIILFKIPSGANENECESFFNDILAIINDGGDNLYSSEIVKRTQWKNDVIETIGEFLYVRKGKHVIVPHGLDCVCGRAFDELYDGNKRVAVIQTGHSDINYWRYTLFAFVVILCMFLISKCISSHFEENRVNSNQTSYSYDIGVIDSISNVFYALTSDSHSYAPYISGQAKQIIANQIDSLRNEANTNIANVSESGNYSPIIINRDIYLSSISKLVQNAKGKEKEVLEMNRKKANKEAFDKDMLVIGSLCDLLYSETSGRVSYADRQFINVENTLDSLEKTAKNNIKDVEFSGVYSSVCSDSGIIKKRIYDIVDNARIKSYNKVQHKNTQKSNTDDNRFTQIVRIANTECVKYYTTGDEVAGRNARNNYKKALDIKYDSNIYSKWKKLNDIFK